MLLTHYQRRRLFFITIFVSFFVVLLSSSQPVNAAKACAETGCAEYGCNSGLVCNSGNDTCGIKYNTCTGATCVADNAWDVSSPCTTADACTPAATTRTATWGTYGACSVTCGVGTQTRTCTCGTQNDCSVQCTTPTANCDGTDSLDCCIDQAPQVKPVITSVGTGSCSKNDPMTVNWTFADTGSDCGNSWGYKCGGNTNTFLIKVDGVTSKSGISSALRTYVLTTTVAASHQIQVCAENGFSENCSSSYLVTIDNTAPPIPVPTVEYVSEGVSCPGKYKLKYSWNAVSDSGCATMNSSPYWSQSSLSNTFPINLFPINTWGNYTTQTTSSSYSGGTTLYAHVQSRDALDNQSGYDTTSTTVIIPTPALYPTIHIDGPYQEKIVDSGATSCSSMSINEIDLTLQANIPPYVTPICTKTAASYSCNFIIDNQTPANACVSDSITIGMNGVYSGYSSVGWLSGESCSGTTSTFTLSAGDSRPNIPLFFTYDVTGLEGWFKVSNASFTNRSATSRNNFIPNHIQAYDSTDDVSTHNFSIKNAGIINQQSLLNVGANSHDSEGNPIYSTPNIYTSGYSQINDVDYEKYTQYVKARKGFTTQALLSDIASDGVYIISSPIVIDAASSTLLSNKKVVLIAEGTNTITITSDFNPTNAAVALVGPTIAIDPSVKNINAILIAGTIQTGESVNELKISGNVVSQNILILKRKRSNPQKPSFFVDFNMKAYIDLLPYLSVSTYDWKQTQ